MNFDEFDSYLRELKPSGQDDFESLIGKLFEALLEQRFYLVKSGYQAGKDLTSSGDSGNSIFVECKRYKESTSLNKRELLGELLEISQGIEIPDLWVLVSTRSVDADLNSALKNGSKKLGFSYFNIDSEGAEKSRLYTLLANKPDIVLGHFKKGISEYSEDKAEQAKQFLENIALQESFSENLEKLKNDLIYINLGYGDFRNCQNGYFQECITLKDKSIARLKQDITIKGNETSFVQRREATDELDSWYKSWPRTRRPFLMLGEEGDGKTWSTCDWASGMLEAGTLPPIVFLTSQMITSDEPIEVVADIVKKVQGSGESQFWKKLLEKWLSSDCESPRLLLVIDGINENPSFGWSDFLNRLFNEPFSRNIGIVITSRDLYWEKHKKKAVIGENRYVIKPYNETELTEALELKGITLDEITPSIMRLISKPRYFNLMVNLRDSFEGYSDITVDALIYEDVKNRYRMNSLKGVMLADDDFQNILVDLARKWHPENDIARSVALGELQYDNPQILLSDLESGGVLIKSRNSSGKYEISPDHLLFAVAILLIDEINKENTTNPAELHELIVNWLIGYKGYDHESKICGSALFYELSKKDSSESTCKALFKYWITTQNHENYDSERMLAIFPRHTKLFLDIAEYVWSSNCDNHIAEELFMNAFLKYGDKASVKPILQEYLNKWLGLIYYFGSPWRSRKQEEKDKGWREMSDRLGVDVSLGRFFWDDYEFLVVNDEMLLRLRNVALTIISHRKRDVYLQGFVKAALAGNAMGAFDIGDKVTWVLRTSPDDLWPAFHESIEKLHSLYKQQQKDFILCSIHQLLSCFGSEEAFKMKNSLPPNPYRYEWPKEWDIDWFATNLSKIVDAGEAFSRGELKHMKKLVIDPDFIFPDKVSKMLPELSEIINPHELHKSMWRAEVDVIYEDFELVFCRLNASGIAELIRLIARGLQAREGTELFLAVNELNKHSILIGKEELSCIKSAWEKTLVSVDDDNQVRDTECTLLDMLLQSSSAEEQLAMLIKRGGERQFFLRTEQAFKNLPSEYFVEKKEFIEAALKGEGLKPLLWFFSVNSDGITPELVKRMLEFVKSRDSVVRACILWIIANFEDEEISNVIIESGWRYEKDDNDQYLIERNAGSRVLCKYGHKIALQEILGRITPYYWWQAVRERGQTKEEVSIFTEFIHELKEKKNIKDLLTSFNGPEYDVVHNPESDRKPNFKLSSSHFIGGMESISPLAVWGGGSRSNPEEFQDPLKGIEDGVIEEKQQMFENEIKRIQGSGFEWFMQFAERDALEAIINTQPEYAEKWYKEFMEGYEQEGFGLLKQMSFWNAFIGAMLNVQPKKGAELYWQFKQVRNSRHIFADNSDFLSNYLFDSKPSDEIAKLMTEKHDSCRNDAELLQVVFLSQKYGKSDWIFGLIDKLLENASPFNIAQGVKSLGFLDIDNAGNALEKWIKENNESWVMYVAKRALVDYKRNQWSKRWYKAFWEEEDDTKSWAMFRLFLECVDLRYWLWSNGISSEFTCKYYYETRKTYVEMNIDLIKNQIESNKKEHAKTYLGQKVFERQLWPWIN